MKTIEELYKKHSDLIYIKGNELWIEGISFTIEELKEIVETMENQTK